MTTTKTTGACESGVFPTVRVREVDVDLLLIDALAPRLRRGPSVAFERSETSSAASIVLGDPALLARAFAGLVSNCLACMESSAVLRISVRRDLHDWTMRMEHRIRPGARPDDGATELAFSRSVLLGLCGSFAVRTDPTRRSRVLVASLPSVRR